MLRMTCFVRARVSLAPLLLVGLVTGCPKASTDSGDASAAPGTDAGGGEGDAAADASTSDPGHECVTYTAQTQSDTIAGAWAAPNAKNVHEIKVPDEPGGGFLELSIEGAPVGPKLEALVKGVTPAVIGGATAETSATATGLGFEVAGGQTIEVRAISVRNASPGDYPVKYTLTWKYTGAADCYEPNDTREQAKLVPLDTELEAFAAYNRKTNYHVAEDHHDWYRFELKEPAKATFELLSVPSDASIGLHAFDATNAGSIASSVAKPRGQAHAMEMGSLQPGTYYVHVEPASFDAASSTYAQPPLDHAKTPYKFRVRTE